MAITVWSATGQETTPRPLGPGPWLITLNATRTVSRDEPLDNSAALLLPLSWRGAERAGLLVPPPLAQHITCGGLPLDVGLHLMSDRDRLEVGGLRLWISLEGLAQPTAFDPDLHGAEGRCARTLRPLRPGDRVVTCPGTRRRSCSAVYSDAAWSLALKCHHCGFDPLAARWQPSIINERTWHELLAWQPGGS